VDKLRLLTQMPGLTLWSFVTYLWGVQKSYRHTYWSLGSQKTPYHFRFSISSDVFRQSNGPGRPAGVFNADCYGITPQDPNEKRTLVKLSEDPNTAKRFPLATAFTSREQAALECDFWKLVLARKFFLIIPFSHGTEKEYVDAARMAMQEPYDRLEDEKQWSHELLDFINEHSAQLYQHRDAHKPELDLDEWMRVAKSRNNWQLGLWVAQVKNAQAELAAIPNTDALVTLARSLSRISTKGIPTLDRRSEFSSVFAGIHNGVLNTAALLIECEDATKAVERARRKAEATLANLINSRPSADLTSDQPMVFQADA
jgi:hypothetical protein